MTGDVRPTVVQHAEDLESLADLLTIVGRDAEGGGEIPGRVISYISHLVFRAARDLTEAMRQHN